MSNRTYEELLREAVVDLREQLKQDEKIKEEKLPKDKLQQFHFFLQNWSTVYIRYVQIFRNLEECYDQILQPQKRADIRILLDSCIGRMLELKFQMVAHCGEYVNFDDVLVDLKLTPDVLEIPIPRYFLEERKKELEERSKLLLALMEMYGQRSYKDFDDFDDDTRFTSSEEALIIIQCNERGRQGRQRAKFMKEIREQEERERKVLEYGISESDPNEAATKIQKVFKGCMARKIANQMRQQELEFLGMEESRIKEKAADKAKLIQISEWRKLAQAQNQQELDQERVLMRQKIKTAEGGKIMENLHDLIMEKFNKLRQASKDKAELPQFPADEEGGSHAFLQDKKELTEEEKIAEDERKKKEGNDAAADDKKGGKDAKKKQRRLVEVKAKEVPKEKGKVLKKKRKKRMKKLKKVNFGHFLRMAQNVMWIFGKNDLIH